MKDYICVCRYGIIYLFMNFELFSSCVQAETRVSDIPLYLLLR